MSAHPQPFMAYAPAQEPAHADAALILEEPVIAWPVCWSTWFAALQGVACATVPGTWGGAA
jgi:hypothetical protein